MNRFINPNRFNDFDRWQLDRRFHAGNESGDWPKCQLHGTNIVHKFPADCKLTDAGALDRLDAAAREAFADGDEPLAEYLGDVCTTCSGCPLADHPHVEFLKGRKVMQIVK